jgi:probable HAF family extracellular repeat protein
VVGLAADPDHYGGEWFAFLYTPENETVDLNTLLPEGSTWRLCRAYDINDQGQIVGRGELAGDPAERAFRYTPAELDGNGEVLVPALVEEIGPLYPDDQVNSALGVNNFGDVCGRVRYDGPTITRIAWYYSDATGITPLLDEANMYATTINNATQILGLDEDSNGRRLFRAFPWDTLETAQFIHSPAGEEYYIWGNDLNDDGWFVGETTLEAVQINKNKVRLRVGAYKCDGVNFVDLGAGSGSEAYGINNHGDVVGTGIAYGCGFLYLEGVGLVNLDDAVTGDPVDLGIWFDAETIIYPWRINDSGQIAGRAYIGLLGDYQGFLLTPVP